MAVTFYKPPIEEVIVGAYFAQPIPLRSEYVGLFWSEVRKDLPDRGTATAASRINYVRRSCVTRSPETHRRSAS
jgi:hypothetical protein